MKIFILTIILFLSATGLQLSAQGAAGDDASYELAELIDLQTTGILNEGDLGVKIDALPLGILTTNVELSPFQNFSFGISYGGSNIIGSGDPDFYSIPAFHAKYRIFTEIRRFPSISIGFNSQGKGRWIDSLDRYDIKSPGAYLVVSKNFKLLGYITFHSMINYSLENKDGDENVNFSIGTEKTFGPTFSAVLEYDFAINDNSTKSLGDGKGYLNFGFRWSASKDLTLGLDFRNLLDNKKYLTQKGGERAFNLLYNINLF